MPDRSAVRPADSPANAVAGPAAPAHATPRPPAWTFAGGGLLAAIAGYINGVVLSAGSLPVTHLTGSVSQVSVDLGRGEWGHAVTLAAIVGAFILGAAISGALVGDTRLRTGRPYGLVMLLEAAILAVAAITLDEAAGTALPLAAAAAGMQNAMASSYGRMILRTTHLTGIATDLGLLLGRVLRGDRPAVWQFGLLGLLFASFAAAGTAGWAASNVWGGRALLVPAIVLLVGGAAYRRWRRRWAAEQA